MVFSMAIKSRQAAVKRAADLLAARLAHDEQVWFAAAATVGHGDRIRFLTGSRK
jgi:hypothetical protein